LKNGWKSTEADKMGQWKAFWNLLGFTQRVCAQVDFCWNAAADVCNVDGVSREDAKARRRRKKEVSVSREDAETRRVGDRVPQLPKAFCGSEGVLECSGLTELWMGMERVDGKIQSGVKPPQSKKEGCGISREDAKARRVGDSPSCAVTQGVLWL
jgi:hypothetical protein